jgi:hypothetical protein
LVGGGIFSVGVAGGGGGAVVVVVVVVVVGEGVSVPLLPHAAVRAPVATIKTAPETNAIRRANRFDSIAVIPVLLLYIPAMD